jgi:hypothetical protein
MMKRTRAEGASVTSHDGSVGMAAATNIFRHIRADGKRTFYNDDDCQLIAQALAYGDAIVRLTNVELGSGSDPLRFEIRFGPAARLRGKQGLSPTGMCQVNLDTGTTRIVEQLSGPPERVFAGFSPQKKLAKSPSSSSAKQGRAHPSPKTPKTPSKSATASTVYAEDVGKACKVSGYDSPGLLMFYGPHVTHGRIRCGVILDTPTGINNGTVQGHQYFSCPPKRGLLVVPDKVTVISPAPITPAPPP